MRSLISNVTQADLDLFLQGYMYRGEAVLVDRLVALDRETATMNAELDTERPLAYSRLQQTTEEHPHHVSAGDLLMTTGTLGCLYAWLELG